MGSGCKEMVDFRTSEMAAGRSTEDDGVRKPGGEKYGAITSSVRACILSRYQQGFREKKCVQLQYAEIDDDHLYCTSPLPQRTLLPFHIQLDGRHRDLRENSFSKWLCQGNMANSIQEYENPSQAGGIKHYVPDNASANDRAVHRICARQ